MKPSAFRPSPLQIKAAITLVWLVLLGLLLQRDYFIATIAPEESAAIAQAEREEYQAIYFHDRRIGYVATVFTPGDDGRTTLDQQARLVLNVAGAKQPIDLHLTAVITADSRLQDFTFSFRSPYYKMEADGVASGRGVSFTLTTNGTTTRERVELAAPPRLSTSRRGYLLRPGLETGDKVRIPWFDPLVLAGKEAVVEYRGRDKVLIHGRVQNLHHFTETFAGTRISSWLDDRGDVLKEESPAGFVFLKEPKFKALAASDEMPELLTAVSAPVVGTMPPLAGLAQIRYRLRFPDDGGFVLDSGRQHYAEGILTITAESQPAAPASVPACAATPADLAATRMVQTGHPSIRDQVAEITAGRTSPAARLQAIAAWVHAELEKRPVLGLPDALTVLASRRGDCNEHAVLFAALARTAGIPCRIAAGVVFLKDAFYYHAWNEVCLDGRWLTVDTTFNQLPADLGHIKFVAGEFQDQIRLGALIGQLTIEPLPPIAAPRPPASNTHQPSRKP